jgi:hypothetical protein
MQQKVYPGSSLPDLHYCQEAIHLLLDRLDQNLLFMAGSNDFSY